MHEIRIAEDLSLIILETTRMKKLSKVTKVNISFGQLIQIVPDIFEFAFREIVRNSVVQDAEIDIEIIPVKMKWLAWLTATYIIWALIFSTWLSRLYLLTMYANYLLFFGPYFLGRLKAYYRREKFKRDMQAGQIGTDESDK